MKEMMLWEGGPRYRSDEQMPLTTDAVLLADFTRARTGERGADLGCGSGILMLLLLWREKELRMTGLELRREACAFARENIERNGLGDRAEVMQGDLRETVKRLPNGGFDFVISNPPYYGTGQGKLPADRDRAAATAETALSLPEVCRAASRLCRSGGRAYFCYRTERLAILLEEMKNARLEPKRLRFVHHNPDTGASLALVEGRKDGRPGIAVERPLLIRDAEGQESTEYRRICHVD